MKLINCEWMGIKLKSPYILASLSLMSNVCVQEHIKYFQKVEAAGAGAIILPSLNPMRTSNEKSETFNKTFADCLPLKTGLQKNGNMAFTVLGPINPNIVSLNYAVTLAKEMKKNLSIPVLGSLVNIGNKKNFLNAIKLISETGIDGLELNFSCPNILTENCGCNLTLDFLREIRQITNLPISLKLSPNLDNSDIICKISSEIDSLTISNAYIGLVPPNVNSLEKSYFKGLGSWSPSGIYGPFERYLTYYRLYLTSGIVKPKNIDLACVGGIVTPEQGIEAILLGANVVQLSSVIAWSGINVFKSFNEELKKYNSFLNIEDIRGQALKYIVHSADNLYESGEIKKRVRCKANINETKCIGCGKCCNRMCLAIQIRQNGKGIHKAYVNKELCSGCGWCYNFCSAQAIDYF